MKKLLVSLLAGSICAGLAGPAAANPIPLVDGVDGIPIVDLFGDKDGFGLGVLDGETFNWADVNGGVPDGDGTDEWVFGDQSWTHTISLLDPIDPEDVTAAWITVFHGGDGQAGPATLFLNGDALGLLADLDDGAGTNVAAMEVFDLMDYRALLLSGDPVEFTVATPVGTDGWVLDYSEIQMTVLPEPASILLLVSGLLGLLQWRRSRRLG